MSKIGNLPIKIPQGVEITIEKSNLKASGPKGEVSLRIPRSVEISQEEATLEVSRAGDSKEAKSLHGLTRSLISNAVTGVSEGFSKTLQLSGVGFRASLQGDKIVLSVGYSHPVEVEKPEGITFGVSENKITVSGADRGLVGETASRIKKIRPAEPYKGKGIKYQGEIIRRKSGKAQAAGGTQ